MSSSNLPIIGICDRCGVEIPRKEGESHFRLQGLNIKMDLETYRLHYLLCKDCRREFEKWIANKGEI